MVNCFLVYIYIAVIMDIAISLLPESVHVYTLQCFLSKSNDRYIFITVDCF